MTNSYLPHFLLSIKTYNFVSLLNTMDWKKHIEKMINKVSFLSCTLFIVCSLITYGQDAQADQFTAKEVNEFRSLFIQMAVLLGMAIVVFLYVNLRSNKTRRRPPAKLKLTHPSNQDTQISEEHLQQVVDLIPYAACIVNADGIPQFFNEQFEQSTQQSFKTILSRHWKELLKLQPGEILASTHAIKNSALYKTNNHLLLKVTQTPIHNNSSLLFIVSEDVTHLETKVEDLKVRINYFRYMINQSTSAIFITDITGRILDTNSLATQLTTMSFEELKQKNIHHFIPFSLQNEFSDCFKDAVEANTKCQLTGHSFTIGDKTIPVDLTMRNFNYFGQEAKILIINDVTDRVQFEQQYIIAQKKAEESDRLKSNFLANMSHEVRTPMNSIMGFSELMCDSQLSHSERREFHQIVKNSAQELLNLLDDIIEFSKIETGQIQLKNEVLNPEQLLEDLKTATLELLKSKPDLSFSLTSPIGISSLPPIYSDQERIAQILRNLLNNAVKFTYTGDVKLGYTYRPDGSIDFFVTDTGIGIPQAKIAKIFHKFRQADEDNNREFGGAGLGLSMSQQLARHLNGFLWVESQEHVGSTFHLILPSEGSRQEIDPRDLKTIMYYCEDTNAPELPVIQSSGNHQIIKIFNDTELQNIPIANPIAGILLQTKPKEERLDKLFEIIPTNLLAFFDPDGASPDTASKNNILTLTNESELVDFIDCCLHG